MNYLFHLTLDWSEIWATLIPFAFYLYYNPNFYWRKPIIIYLWVALVLSLISDFIWFGNKEKFFDLDNNVDYNILCILSFFLFTWFFFLIQKSKYLYLIIISLFTLFILFIFIFLQDNFSDFSSKLFAFEAGTLLFYCIRYFNSAFLDEKFTIANNPVFLIVSGLCIYNAINFFIFLFYNYLVIKYRDYAVGVWDVHNISYIILCIFIARAFKK